MKRNIIAAFLAIVLCLSLAVTVFAADSELLLIDQADLLSSPEEAQLSQKLQRISQTHDAQIVIVTMDDMGTGSIDYYVEQLYDSVGFGYGANKDGVLLLVCMDVREFRILSNGFAADAISYSQIDGISDAIVSDLSDGDYAAAFDTFADRCDYYIDGYLNGYPFDFGGSLTIALAIGVVAGLVVALVLKGQLKSVRKQNRANVYVKPGSMQLTTRSDLFLYRNLTRTKKETNNGPRSGGSRGGSSRRVGGRSF